MSLKHALCQIQTNDMHFCHGRLPDLIPHHHFGTLGPTGGVHPIVYRERRLSGRDQQDIATSARLGAIERLHEEFKRRIKTQTVLPSAETAAMMFWALLASGQISMRKVDGWKTHAAKSADLPIDLAA